MSKSARGAVAASVSFRGLGRAVSFASGYFLASGGIVFGLKAATKAAIEHQAQTAQLAAAVTHAGVSYKDYSAQIQSTLKAQRDLAGFSEDDTARSFTKLLRTTTNVSSALKDSALAMELARGAGVSLNTASQAINKTLAGNTTALHRTFAVEIPKGATAYRALQLAAEKYAGSTVAYSQTAAGAQARLTNALHETEVTVGTALLPTLTKYSTELADWLNKSGNQRRIQQDMNKAVKEGTTVVKDITSAVKLASSSVGGFKNLIEGLVVLKFASAATAWVSGFAAAGAAAGGAATKMGRVGAALGALRLASVAPIIFTVEVIGLRAAAQRIKDLQNQALNAAAAPTTDQQKAALVPRLAKEYKQYRASGMSAHDAIVKLENELGAGIHRVRVRDKSDPSGAHDTFRTVGGSQQAADIVASAINYSAGGPEKRRIDALRKKQGDAAKKAAAAVKADASAPLDALSRIQDQVAQARLAVAQKQKGSTAKLVAALKAETDYDKKYAAIQEQLAAQGGKNAKKHSQTAQALLASETADLNEITSLTDKHKKKAKKKIDLATSFTVPIGLRIAQAKAATTVSTADDVKVAREIDAFARKMIASGKKKGQALVDAWNEIAAQMAVIGTKNQSQVHSVVESSAQFVKGIHFATNADKVAAEARFAQAQAHGGHVPSGRGVAGQYIQTNTSVYLDGTKIGESTTRHQQRAGSHAAVQTRGPNAGRNARVH